MAHSNVQIGGIAYLFIAIVVLLMLPLSPSSTITSSSVRTFYASGMVNAYHVIGKSHGVSSAAAAAAVYIFILLRSSHLFYFVY